MINGSELVREATRDRVLEARKTTAPLKVAVDSEWLRVSRPMKVPA